jgi:hypothetical protein
MQFIYNYILAKRVCKKYGINFVLLRNSSVGSNGYSMWWNDNSYAEIYVNLFYKDFEAIFWHELGHIIYHRSRYNKDHFNKWMQEAKAWRFANKVTKGKYLDISLYCFRTYTQKSFSSVKSEWLDYLVNKVIQLEKLIVKY